MRQHSWVLTVVCTKPVPGPRGRWSWTKLFDSEDSSAFGFRPNVQIWCCNQDLKESLVEEAQKAFGKALDQIVRLGSCPEVLYPQVMSCGSAG